MTPPPDPATAQIAGVLLAAGSGKRFGGPKALADTGSGPWVLRALGTLVGLGPTLVVTGAAADDVTALLPAGVIAVHNPDYDSGMGSSLVAALTALPAGVDAAVIMLVDLPDVPAEAVTRVIAEAAGSGSVINSLARAAYRGAPGHPVLIGAAHFAGVIRAAGGDRGARDYLATNATQLVECGDLAGGRDVDTPPSGI